MHTTQTLDVPTVTDYDAPQMLAHVDQLAESVGHHLHTRGAVVAYRLGGRSAVVPPGHAKPTAAVVGLVVETSRTHERVVVALTLRPRIRGKVTFTVEGPEGRAGGLCGGDRLLDRIYEAVLDAEPVVLERDPFDMPLVAA